MICRKEKKRKKKTKKNYKSNETKPRSGMIRQHQMNMKKKFKINKNEKKRRNKINVETNSTNYLCAEKNLLWEICAREFI